MSELSHRGSIVSLKQSAIDARNKALGEMRELMKDEKFKKFKRAYENYELEVIERLKSMTCDEIKSYAVEIAVCLAELKLLSSILKHEVKDEKSVREEKTV